MLRRYLKYQKTVMALSRKVVSTLVYPAILILLSVGLITILMTYVIPRFTEFFADFNADLPLLTVVVLGRRDLPAREHPDPRRGARRRSGYFASRWLKTTRGREWLRRRDPEAPDRRRHLPAVRDHAVHAQPRDAARRRHAARPGARERGRRDRQPLRLAARARGRPAGARGRASSGRRSRRPASSPT